MTVEFSQYLALDKCRFSTFGSTFWFGPFKDCPKGKCWYLDHSIVVLGDFLITEYRPTPLTPTITPTGTKLRNTYAPDIICAVLTKLWRLWADLGKFGGIRASDPTVISSTSMSTFPPKISNHGSVKLSDPQKLGETQNWYQGSMVGLFKQVVLTTTFSFGYG